MITKSAKKPVDEGHERPSHACGSGSALPGVCARHLPILRDCEGHHERRTPRSMLSMNFEEEVLVLEAA